MNKWTEDAWSENQMCFYPAFKKSDKEWNSIAKISVCYDFKRDKAAAQRQTEWEREQLSIHEMRKIKVKVINKPHVFPDALKLLISFSLWKSESKQQ